MNEHHLNWCIYDLNNVFRLSIADTKTRQTEKNSSSKSQLNINILHSGSPSFTDPDFVFALILKSKKNTHKLEETVANF